MGSLLPKKPSEVSLTRSPSENIRKALLLNQTFYSLQHLKLSCIQFCFIFLEVLVDLDNKVLVLVGYPQEVLRVIFLINYRDWTVVMAV